MRTLPAARFVFILLAGMLPFFNRCSKKNDAQSLVINPTVHPIAYSVRAYLITPADRTFNPHYYTGARACMLRLQAWYKSQLGTNKTFALNPVVVDTITGLHPSTWFSSYNGPAISGNETVYAYYNTKYEMQQLLGADFDTTHYVYFAYVVSDFPDETIPRGLAVEGLANLEGISGDSPDSWIGAAGHALGHAFGLSEPETENSNAIMSKGYSKYPHCIFTQVEKDSLNASPFIQLQ